MGKKVNLWTQKNNTVVYIDHIRNQPYTGKMRPIQKTTFYQNYESPYHLKHHLYPRTIWFDTVYSMTQNSGLVHQANVRNSPEIFARFKLCQVRFTSADHNLFWQLVNSKQCDAYSSRKKITSLFTDFDWKYSLSYYPEMFLNKSFKITMGAKQAKKQINVIHVKLNSSCGNVDFTSSKFLIIYVGGNWSLSFRKEIPSVLGLELQLLYTSSNERLPTPSSLVSEGTSSPDLEGKTEGWILSLLPDIYLPSPFFTVVMPVKSILCGDSTSGRRKCLRELFITFECEFQAAHYLPLWTLKRCFFYILVQYQSTNVGCAMLVVKCIHMSCISFFKMGCLIHLIAFQSYKQWCIPTCSDPMAFCIVCTWIRKYIGTIILSLKWPWASKQDWNHVFYNMGCAPNVFHTARAYWICLHNKKGHE